MVILLPKLYALSFNCARAHELVSMLRTSSVVCSHKGYAQIVNLFRCNAPVSAYHSLLF